MGSSSSLQQRGDMSEEEDDEVPMLFDFMHTVYERYAGKYPKIICDLLLQNM